MSDFCFFLFLLLGVCIAWRRSFRVGVSERFALRLGRGADVGMRRCAMGKAWEREGKRGGKRVYELQWKFRGGADL